MGEAEDRRDYEREMRDLRERVIRLEEREKPRDEWQKGMDMKVWAIVGLVVAFVGKQLLALIGGTP